MQKHIFFKKKSPCIFLKTRVNQLFCRGHLTGNDLLGMFASIFLQIGRNKVDFLCKVFVPYFPKTGFTITET